MSRFELYSWRHAPRASKTLGLGLLVLLLTGLVCMLPAIPQPPAYHEFADRRPVFGLANGLDTLSNGLFLLAGGLGLACLRSASQRGAFSDRREAWPYALFFVAVILIGFASGFYHLAPDNERLVWDRAAMALAFTAWSAAVISERVSLKAGLVLLPLLLAAGLGSVFYWGWSETQGQGDLRAYGLMQLLPILLIPLLLWLYPTPGRSDREILTVIGLYLLALFCDFSDRAIFALSGGVVSGHTLKHMIAALAAVWVARYLWRRGLRVGGQNELGKIS